MGLRTSSNRTLINERTCEPTDWDQVPCCPSPRPPPTDLPQPRYTCVTIRQIMHIQGKPSKGTEVCKPPDMVTVLRRKRAKQQMEKYEFITCIFYRATTEAGISLSGTSFPN